MLFKVVYCSLFVYSVVAVTTFINQGNRAKLFELTDNQVATLRITIPDDKLTELKYVSKKLQVEKYKYTYSEYLDKLQTSDFATISLIKGINFKTLFPGYNNLPELLSDLKIDENGFSNIDINEIKNYYDGLRNNSRSDDLPKSAIDMTNINQFLSNLDMTKVNIREIPPQLLSLLNHSDNFVEYKINNADMSFEINKEKSNFNNVTFSLGGKSSRTFNKVAYNIKIHGDNLYGRKDLRLRADYNEPTFLRTKLYCDITNRLGIPSISANYVSLYINDEYMGLYILLDIYKSSWIKYNYNEANTSSLYKCGYANNYLTAQIEGTCNNDKDEVSDTSQWKELLETLDNAQTAADIENIFDIDLFLSQVAIEYLTGAWDHFLITGNNYYMYKPQNFKWKFFEYDFDSSFGDNIERSKNLKVIITDKLNIMKKYILDYPSISFDNWVVPSHLVDILILKDPTRFETILKNIVEKVFNPKILFSHLDNLKELIKPYVQLEKTQDANGNYPGQHNRNHKDYTLEEFEANSEYTTVESLFGYRTYGIKYWILERYRSVCKTYNMECDAKYLDENYTYDVDKKVEYDGIFASSNQQVYLTSLPTTATSTTISTIISVENPTEIPADPIYNCMAELLGYICCPTTITIVYDHDEYGDWGYDFAKKEWCGLTPYTKLSNETCWSKKLGYPCCNGCKIYESDLDGLWGYEKHQWCGIQPYCQEN